MPRTECVGWMENGSWQAGNLSLGLVMGHNTAVEKYHPMPAVIPRLDFEKKIIGNTDERETSYLKSLYHRDGESGAYVLTDGGSSGAFGRRWEIAERIAYTAAKFSSFAYAVTFRAMLNFCRRDCMYTVDNRKRLRMAHSEKLGRFLSDNAVSGHIREFVKSLYGPRPKAGWHTLKREATPAQLRELRDIDELYQFTAGPGRFPVEMPFEERLPLPQIAALAVSVIESLALSERQIVYFLVRDVPQKDIGDLLRLTPVGVSRKIRKIEMRISERLAEVFTDDFPLKVELNVLRRTEVFNTAYDEYEQRNENIFLGMTDFYRRYLRGTRRFSEAK